MRLITNIPKIAGVIKKDLDLYHANLRRATKSAASRAANGLKNDLRSQVRLGGLGPKVANTWRSQAYPKNGDSLDAVASVWSKAPHIIAAFDEGITIKARKKRYLAIPSHFAPAKGTDGKKIKPSNFPVKAYGELRFVKGKNGTDFLVVDQLRQSFSKKTGSFRGYKKASAAWLKRGKAVESIVMFFLIDQTNPKKRLDVRKAAEKWHAEFPRLIDQGIKP